MDAIESQFLTIAAIAALALVGLTFLAASLRTRREFSEREIVVLRTMTLTGLSNTTAAFVPFLIAKLDVNSVWTVSSLLLLVAGGALLGIVFRQFYTKSFRVYSIPIASLMFGLGMVMLLFNFANVLLWHTSVPFLFGLLLGLMFMGSRLYLLVMFLTVRPEKSSMS